MRWSDTAAGVSRGRARRLATRPEVAKVKADRAIEARCCAGGGLSAGVCGSQVVAVPPG